MEHLDKKKAGAYRANTSANSLVEKLIREGRADIKHAVEALMCGGILHMEIEICFIPYYTLVRLGIIGYNYTTKYGGGAWNRTRYYPV